MRGVKCEQWAHMVPQKEALSMRAKMITNQAADIRWGENGAKIWTYF
jgi:hypothetical protein